MSLKLKVLGLGVLATLAMSAVAAMNASALSSGHFTSDAVSGNTTIVGSENSTHFLEFTSHGLEGGIVCDTVSYHGSATGATVTSLTITPTYSACHTTGAAAGTTVVTHNGCNYTFTPGGNGTVHLVCPAGKAIEIHHPNCTITVPPQTVSGVTYTTDVENTKHTITLDVNAEFETQYHGGICIFTGTGHRGTLHGSATVKGLEAGTNNQVNITAT